MKSLLTAVLAASVLAAPLSAGALEAGTEAISFAAGWRATSGEPENLLQLGVVHRCRDAWCASIEAFPGKDNLQRQPLPMRHEMEAPYKKPCVNEHLTTIEGAPSKDAKAKIEESGDTLTVQAGGYAYTWRKDPAAKGAYRLEAVNNRDGGALDQVVGYAFEGTGPASELAGFDTLQTPFDGEIDHKDTLAGVEDDWRHSATSLDFRKFQPSATNPSLEGYSVPGQPDILKRMRSPIWAHNSVALLPAKDNWVRYVLHEYGHDFNANGCFDEFGHNKLMLPVQRQGGTAAFVFIEYTPDNKDGVPMLSVGRYFLK